MFWAAVLSPKIPTARASRQADFTGILEFVFICLFVFS
jgi:hypothetical protein